MWTVYVPSGPPKRMGDVSSAPTAQPSSMPHTTPVVNGVVTHPSGKPHAIGPRESTRCAFQLSAQKGRAPWNATSPVGPVTLMSKKWRNPDHLGARTRSGSTTSWADVVGSMIWVATIGDEYVSRWAITSKVESLADTQSPLST